MADLEKKVKAMYGKHSDIGGKLKSVDRRIKTLEEHLRHSGNFKANKKYKTQYEKLYAEYQTLKKSKGIFADRKTRKALDTANEYHETYRTEITTHENAERYLRDVLQERFDINTPHSKRKLTRFIRFNGMFGIFSKMRKIDISTRSL